jgi:hypothetical protein
MPDFLLVIMFFLVYFRRTRRQPLPGRVRPVEYVMVRALIFLQVGWVAFAWINYFSNSG